MMKRSVLLMGLLAATAACGNSSDDENASTGGAPPGTGGQGAAQAGGAPTGGVLPTGGWATGGGMTGGTTGATSSGGAPTGGTSPTGGAVPTGGVATGGASVTGGAPAGGTPPSGGTGGAEGGTGGQVVETGGGDTGGAEAGGQAGSTSGGGSQTGGGGSTSGCVGDVVPTADPTKAGPFQVAADKEVGPLAGVVPDPIYGNEQQRFNVYRPANLADSGYCHPILVWANGYTDNPEQNPPECVTDAGANKWCGQYYPMMEHLASHGFVVIASLSTATGDTSVPFPTIVGLDWILEQADDSSSPYYHRLDTANIGQLGHSYGGMSTCMSASEPRYKALATICGTRELSGVHTPMLFFCGGKDTTVQCSGVRNVFASVTDQPAFFINELNSDHGSWVYQGPGGVSLSMAAAWFRTHLMGDTESRTFFYGPNCRFCTDSRVQVEQNSLMAQ